MKLDPLVILLNKNFKLDKKYYFISGNENTLIDKIKLLITENFKKEGGFQIKYVDSIANFIDEISLFGDQNIFVAKNCKDINEKNLNNLKNSKGIFIFIQENSQKTKVIKSLFIKDKDSYLIDCYELDRDAKIKILNNYLEANELSFEKNLYWFLYIKLIRYTKSGPFANRTSISPYPPLYPHQRNPDYYKANNVWEQKSSSAIFGSLDWEPQKVS